MRGARRRYPGTNGGGDRGTGDGNKGRYGSKEKGYTLKFRTQKKVRTT